MPPDMLVPTYSQHIAQVLFDVLSCGSSQWEIFVTCRKIERLLLVTSLGTSERVKQQSKEPKQVDKANVLLQGSFLQIRVFYDSAAVLICYCHCHYHCYCYCSRNISIVVLIIVIIAIAMGCRAGCVAPFMDLLTAPFRPGK